MKLYVGNLHKLLFFMEERQRIYLKRQTGAPWPWTNDIVLQRFRFCNTYRQQDRETQWLTKNWLEPYASHSNLWFAVCMFRQINWSPTLEELGFPETWDARKTYATLQKREKRGDKIYTSAYLIPSHGEKQKIRYTVSRVLGPVWKAYNLRRAKANELPNCYPYNSLEEAHGWFMEQYGFGPFISYEVVTDLRHTRYLCNAPDIHTWANPGPGARRGLCRLMNQDLKFSIGRADQIDLMREVLAWTKCERDTNILPTLEMRDIEHSLCEYDKLERARQRLLEGKCVGLENYKAPVGRLI